MAPTIELSDLEHRVLLLSKAVEENTEGSKEVQRDLMEYKTQNKWSPQGVREDNNSAGLCNPECAKQFNYCKVQDDFAGS